MEIERTKQYKRNQVETKPFTIANGRVLKATQDNPGGLRSKIVSFEIAEAAGATPVDIEIQLEDGSQFNLLGTSDAKTIRDRYLARKAAQDPYAGNVFFQPGAAGILFGLANRLRGEEIKPGVIEAKVLGIKVLAPLNHGLSEGETPHHLHGFAFDKPTTISEFQDTHGIHLRAEFESGFHKPFWAGEAQMTVMHSLENGAYAFRMDVKNSGDTDIPMGAGSHPYFRAPSGDASAVKIWIPGRKLVEIDNYTNVLPTGRILSIPQGSEFDFNKSGGRALNGKYLDNLWVDLQLDENGFAFAEFIDTKARLRIRMTALTKNILGIQVYAPRPDDKPELGVFAAIEFVTNLPDPRDELWKDIPTGMKRLEPGEHLRYGYRIETRPFA